MCYQETRGVVEQAAEAAAEVSLQEGGVFWRHGLRVIVGDVADFCRVQVTCNGEYLPTEYCHILTLFHFDASFSGPTWTVSAVRSTRIWMEGEVEMTSKQSSVVCVDQLKHTLMNHVRLKTNI